MQFEENVRVYMQMKKHGVVLYGAGKEGRLALDVLKDENITVFAVGDKNSELEIGTYKCVSLETLCQFDKHVVCIVTPLLPLENEKERLRSHFDTVISNYIIHLIRYFTPDERHLSCFPFNHYESPYLSQSELDNLCENSTDIKDINMNVKMQLEMIHRITESYFDFLDLLDGITRYKKANSYFCFEDALVLSAFIRKFLPNNIIEIGSGFSTCMMLDINEKYFNDNIHIRCIEPYPERLLSNLNGEERNLEITEDFVQNVPLDIFQTLEENDVLFIDSSHVAKVGGDLPYEYFEIFPRLKSGVLIHIHDIFYPFTYPYQWLKEGRCYNEAFILRALLMNSDNYEIIYFNNMMHEALVESIKCNFGSGSSIWIRKK